MMANSLGVYIHIPFCVKKCNYCAFLSGPSDAEGIERYVQALIDEIQKCKVNFTSVDTIYFGGGTPSLLDIRQLEDIMTVLRDKFDISEDAEITLEANPGTLGSNEQEIYDRLLKYREIGINRLSMGVQSMNDEVLKYLGRIHNAEDVKRDFKLARKAGFDNISLDLILSVPYGTEEDERRPMSQAVSDVKSLIGLQPEHVSCYSLQLEEGTQFYNQFEQGNFHEVSDEQDREIYHKVCSILKDAGYEHYEISNFAKPGKKSRHNSRYWNMSDYQAFGLGASGFVNGVRYKNTDDMTEYLAGKYVADEYANTEHDNISEAVFTGLRRNIGIRYDEVFPNTENPEQEFWKYYEQAKIEAENFATTGHLIINTEGIRLTESGIDISNKIMALFV